MVPFFTFVICLKVQLVALFWVFLIEKLICYLFKFLLLCWPLAYVMNALMIVRTEQTERRLEWLAAAVPCSRRGFGSWNRTRVSHPDSLPNKIYSLSRAVPQRDCDVPVDYEATMISVISRRTRSSILCVVVGLVVHVWCECGARGCVRVCAWTYATIVLRWEASKK